ncbi:hypothetical protein HHL19_18675 [Streptomyces sp. R302]|uniref:hypothetical protein n=1 Tax=unclassified Streptomyces TaxID=2593676 RepID=UPI00145DC23C|nr:MULTISPECIES: hypothetical protein [unclassified Streptomyces]NML54794.1 hypothetical protein [Streptomyces sp. R301]NML80637.1 hypothetical protein [Streptomyces sp. R302]
MQDMVLLADAINDVNLLGIRVNGLLTTTVMTVMVSISTIRAWRKTQSVLAAGGALLGGVALWYAVMTAPAFRDSVGETIKPGGAPPVTEGRGPAVVRVVEPVTGTGSGRGGEVL